MSMQGRMGQQGGTGTSNITFNLVSILYHALEGAATYDQYIQDAQQSGQNDIAQFFMDVQQEERQRADRAKQLLAQYLQQSGGTGYQQRAA